MSTHQNPVQHRGQDGRPLVVGRSVKFLFNTLGWEPGEIVEIRAERADVRCRGGNLLSVPHSCIRSVER